MEHSSFVLVLNCGSSSIKYAVIEPQFGTNILHGLVERIGSPEAAIKCYKGEEKEWRKLENIDYRSALKVIMDLIYAFENLAENIVVVGHRVVHGGEFFTESVIIDDKVIDTIRKTIHMAPLHNPANIVGIEEARYAFPNLPQVAVFDTAFHQTMPNYAYIYPIPFDLYKEHKIRRYGFHGTSHRFVAQRAAQLLNKPLTSCSLLTAHLGNGCSAAAILNGKSVDTTMGLTPLEGLMMGTRSGDVDPSLHVYLADNLGLDVHRVTEILNKGSGLLGLSGSSSDMREIEENVAQNDEQSLLAFEVFCYRLAKYIGALAVTLKTIDALIFTGGIGENSSLVREKTLAWLEIFGFKLDAKRNAVHGKNSDGIITKAKSTVAMVIPTNEELLIARDAAFLAHLDVS